MRSTRPTVRDTLNRPTGFSPGRGRHGIHVTRASGRRPRHLAHLAPGNATASRDPALGGARVRDTVRGLSAVPDQDRPLRRRPRGDHLAHPRPGRAEPHRRLVDATDRVPEGHRLHAAVRGCRLRLRIGPAHGTVHAADRRVPLLVAAQHNSTSGVAGQGSVHPRRFPHRRRCRAVRRRFDQRGVGTGVSRARRAGHRCRRRRPDRPRSGASRRSSPWRCWVCATRPSSWPPAANTTG